MPSAISETTTQTRPQSAGGGASGEDQRALIELKGVYRRYRRLVALRGVNLAIQPGEFVFVIGPSEAGKTTLLKLLHGDLRPSRGTIRVDRNRLDRRWRRFLTQHRRDVAAVYQDHRLMRDMTARGNVAFALQVADLGMPKSEVRVRAQTRLQEVGLGARPAAFPDQLSGGQQRRLAIARALGHDPLVLLADEPTASLDRANAERVLELLERRCAAGTTVVVATHDVELALSRPHRVIELREGRIVADMPARAPLPGNGTAAALLAARHHRGPGLGERTGQLMQLVLGYTPPPPPDPRPRVSVRARGGQVAQFVLGYETPPRPRPPARPPARGPWVPPREVLDRLATTETVGGSTNGGNGRNGGNGSTNGAGHGPRSLAALSAMPAAGNGHAKRRSSMLARRAGELAQFVLGYTPPPAREPGPRVSLGRRIGRVMQFVLGYTPPPEMPRPARGPRRWPWTRAGNVGRLAVGGAAVSWLRNFGTAAPALGSITLLLLLAGLISISGFAVRSLLIAQSAEASVLHVYLADDATTDQLSQTHQALAKLPHVRSVRYLDKDQALAQAQQRPGLGDLASYSDSNPFPASFEVTTYSPSDVAAVAKAAASEPGVDTRSPTSYDAGTYDRLRQFTLVSAGVAGAFGLLLLVITYVISSNSIRAAVLARRDELLTMQLVGASPWLVRARLGVEGALTGGLAGVLAAAVVAATCLIALYGARHLFVQVLPGLTVPSVAEALIAVAALGVCLGTVSALFAFRRLRA
ncbi:MAG TPA: permease-like cell division protein FtsX [Terriglobales bacterium]|nr:permease-like cell division protein FtsX [Terriglobales bacterium]